MSTSKSRTCACVEASSAETGSSHRRTRRLRGQGAGDGDSLSLAAGQQQRCGGQVLRLQPDDVEQLQRATPRGLTVGQAYGVQRIPQNALDVPARVEGTQRILVDHLQRGPERAPRLFRHARPGLTEQQDAAGIRLREAEQYPARWSIYPRRLPDKPSVRRAPR